MTQEQVRSLDDALFEANPASYWRARVDALLREPEPLVYENGLLERVLGFGLDPQLLQGTAPTERERHMQRALDAFSLRHHIAESLTRLVHAVLLAGDDHD